MSKEERDYTHGTVGGYAGHRKRSTPFCQPCYDAMSAYNRNYKQTHKKQTRAVQMQRIQDKINLALNREPVDG